MGSHNSSSSTSSSTDTNSDCYFRNRMIQQQQQYLQTHSNHIGNLNPSTQKSTICTNKIQIECNCQGNIVECDENGQIIVK